jgi:hypothetical protein
MAFLLKSFIRVSTALLVIGLAPRCIAQDMEPSEAVTLDVGKRIIALTVPVKDESGVLVRLVHGSGYMLDEHRAITAAHVVRDLHVGDSLVAQVGALRLGTNYVTTARLLRFDARRDLAIIEVDTGVMDLRARLDVGSANICDHPPAPGSKYLVGGMSDNSTGNTGIERYWRPDVFEPILSPESAPETSERDPLGYWHSGDPVILSGENASPGDSGAAVLKLDGCLMGIVSKNAFVKVPVDDRYLGPMFIVPIQSNDSFLKEETGSTKKNRAASK